jgi:hypothetical protein
MTAQSETFGAFQRNHVDIRKHERLLRNTRVYPVKGGTVPGVEFSVY